MLEALTAAGRSIWQPRILRLVWLPLLAALALWALLGLVFWHDLVAALHRLIAFGANSNWYSDAVANVLSKWIVTLAMLLALLPLTYVTALFVTATVAMPIMVEVVAKAYPGLERRHGGTTLGSLWNALWATLVYLLAWIITLPLWLFGVPAVLLPLAINGWYNERLFRYDALAEHADPAEFRLLTRQFRGSWYGLGVVAAGVQLVPFLNLVSPVYSGLSFIHFGLAQLAKQRATAVSANPQH